MKWLNPCIIEIIIDLLYRNQIGILEEQLPPVQNVNWKKTHFGFIVWYDMYSRRIFVLKLIFWLYWVD